MGLVEKRKAYKKERSDLLKRNKQCPASMGEKRNAHRIQEKVS
jgi:hypothetical protein